MKTWQKCGHPRTLENSVGNQFYYGCRKCSKQNKRERYYSLAGWDHTPLPISYRYALKPLHRYRAIRGKSLGARVVDILNEQAPIDRAAYILLHAYQHAAETVAEYFKGCPVEFQARADHVKRLVAATEHQNYYKDWPLVQQLIDEGVSEAEVKEMIGISQPGWDAAKRRGAVSA